MSKILKFIKKRWYLALAVLIVVFLLLNSLLFNKNKQELTFINPQKMDLTKSLEISGIVDAKQKVRLSFLAGSKVTYIGAEEGESVAKWQTIASVDTSTLQKQKEQSLNTYEQTRLSWEDVLEANEDQGLTDAEQRAEDRNQLTLDNSVLTVEIADIAIKNSAIYAPFAGILTHAPNVVAGVQWAATDYYEIVDPETLIFKATVDETDLSLLSKGQSAQIDFDAYDEDFVDTYLSYISYSSTNTSSGTVFLLEFPLEGLSIEKYRLGMNGDVMIKLEEKDDVLALPIETLRESDGKSYVDIKAVNKEGYEEREIKVGLETDEYFEVLEGLSETDQVLMPE
jgi:HlyD family secretion protein